MDEAQIDEGMRTLMYEEATWHARLGYCTRKSVIEWAYNKSHDDHAFYLETYNRVFYAYERVLATVTGAAE